MPGAAGGGREVGRISIRVVPDLDEFRSKVAAAAKGIPDAKVHVDSDAEEAREKIVAETRDLPDAKVKVDVEQSSLDRMRQKLEQVNLAFERRMKSALQQKDLIPDAQKEMERRLGRIDLGWDKKMEALKRSPLTDMEEKFKLKPALDEAAIEELRLRLAHENFTAKVKLETDRNNLERMARNVEHEFGQKLDKIFGQQTNQSFFSRLGAFASRNAGGGGFSGGGSPLSSLGSIGNFGSPINLLAIASVLPPALAMFSQVAVSIPAMLAAIAAPLGVFVLGIGGVKKALEDVGLAGEDKKGKLKVGEVFKKIRQPIEDTFEQGFKPILQSLVDAASKAPVFTTGLQFIAKGIVNFANGISDAVLSAPNLALLDRMTNSIGTMLTNLTPGITAFSNGMIRLTTDVGDHLPGLGNWVTGLADRFSNWIAEIDKPKKDWFGKDVPGSSTLDSAVSNMKPILNSIVDFVGSLMDSGVKLAADPNMANNIKTIVDGIRNFINESLPALSQAFGGLAELMRTMHLDHPPAQMQPPNGNPTGPGQDGKPAQPVMPIEPKATGSNGNFQWLTPDPKSNNHKGWGALDKLEDNLQHWGDADRHNPFFGSDKHIPFEKQGILDKLESDPLRVMDDIGKWWQKHDGRDALSGLLGRIGIGTPQASAEPQPFNPGPVAPGKGLGAAAGQVPGAAQATAGAQQAQQAAQGAQQAAQGVQQAFAGLPGALQGVWTAIANGAKTAFDGLVKGAQTAVQQILAEVQKLPGEITQALSGLRAAGEAAGRSLGEGLASGITAGKAQAVAAAADMAAAVNAAGQTHFQINSPSKVWRGYGSGLGEGLGEGIDAGSGDAVTRAQDLAKQINDAMQGGVDLNPKQVQEQMKRSLAELDVERDRLQAQRDGIPTGPSGKEHKAEREGLKNQRASVSEQLRRVKQARDALTSERDEMKLQGLDGKSDSMSEAAQMITKALAQVLDGAKSTVMAGAQQFESDIGISGKGAIPTIANFGIGWAQKEANNMINSAFGLDAKGPKQSQGANDVHIHVNSVDDAIAVKRNEDNKKALQYTRR